MKKIVFVQKEENTYDPVTAFFNKKPPSVSKNLSSTAKPNIAKNSNTPSQKMANTRNDEITPKIGKKGEYQPLQIPKPNPIKQQTIYKNRQPTAKSSLKKEVRTNQTKQENTKSSQKSIQIQKIEKIEYRQDSIQKNKEEEEAIKPFKKQNKIIESGKLENLLSRIKELEARQQEYLRRIEEFEGKEEKYVKNQQKLAKIQKDMKSAVQKSKEADTALERLKQKEAQIKQMLDGTAIPFNRKREVILTNKIKQLKRINRQLVLRLKNYKGTDLVELSIHQTRQEITKELYTVDVENDLRNEMNVEMESLTAQLINKLNGYIEQKVKDKEKTWANQQLFLMEVINLSEKISLNYLNQYEVCPLPKSNEQAVSIYSILEEYKSSNKMKKLIDRYHLNLALSAENMSIISNIQSSHEQQVQIRQEVTKPKRKKQDKSKMADYLRAYEQRSNFNEILLIQNICQLQYIKDWIDRMHSKVIQEISTISKVVTEIRDLISLGPSAKQSLYYYLETNFGNLEAKFPSLKLQLKQISNNFAQILRDDR